MALKVILVLFGLGFLGYAALLWRDPTLIYRGNWLNRQVWGWLEGNKKARLVAFAASWLAIIGGGATLALAFLI